MDVLDSNAFVLLDVSVDPRAMFSRSESFWASRVVRDEPDDKIGARTRLRTSLEEGSEWVFYGGGYRDEHGSVQLATSASARVKGPCKRTTDPCNTQDGHCKHTDDPCNRGEYDGRVVFLRGHDGRWTGRRSPGVATFWLATDAGDEDPLELKKRAAADQDQLCEWVEALGCSWEDVGRIFVFVASQVDTDNLESFVADNAAGVGRLFTGEDGDETDELLKEYATADISTRRSERLYVRWSDGLALYDNSDRGTRDREAATMRALRITKRACLCAGCCGDASYDLTRHSARVSAVSVPFVSEPWRESERIKRTVAEARLTTLVKRRDPFADAQERSDPDGLELTSQAGSRLL